MKFIAFIVWVLGKFVVLQPIKPSMSYFDTKFHTSALALISWLPQLDKGDGQSCPPFIIFSSSTDTHPFPFCHEYLSTVLPSFGLMSGTWVTNGVISVLFVVTQKLSIDVTGKYHPFGSLYGWIPSSVPLIVNTAVGWFTLQAAKAP